MNGSRKHSPLHRIRTALCLCAFLPFCLCSPARADSGWADSADFGLDLVDVPTAGGTGAADSADFSLNLYGVNRGWADSADFSLDEPDPNPVLADYGTSATEIEVGQSFDVYAVLNNTGGAGDHGGITISFPGLTEADDTWPYDTAQATVEVHGDTTFTTVSYADAGDTVDIGGTLGSAEHLLVEGDEDGWDYNETQTLKLTVTPKQCGTFKIRLRGWIGKGGEYGYGPPTFRDPSGSGDGRELDQQQYWSYVLTVTVNPSDPPNQTRSAEYVGAWDLHAGGITGEGIKIGVVEFAAPPAHAAIADRLLPPLEGDAGTTDPDDIAHSLMVCGLAAGYVCNPAHTPPATPYSAMAPGAYILPAAVERDPFSLSEWTDEFQGLYDHLAAVITCSVGSKIPKNGDDDLESFLDQVVDEGDVVITAAVGDTDAPSQPTSPVSPAVAYNVIAVGAVRDRNENYGSATAPTLYDLLDDRSVIGPGRGRCKPDIVAPGDANWPVVQNGVDSFTSYRGETSAAAPHVAGAAALLIDAHRSAYGSTPEPYLIKCVLLTSADKNIEVPAGVGDPPSEEPRSWETPNGSTQPLDYALGAGLLDVREAHKLLMQQDSDGRVRRRFTDSVTWQTDPTATVSLGSINEPKRIVATLSWDAHYDNVLEGSEINKLHLFLYRNGTEMIAESDSNVDNVQHIWTPITESGDYSLKVEFAGHETGITETEDFAVAYILIDYTPADFDFDGDVDQDDLSLFDACFSGPAVSFAVGCGPKDLDTDGDVDQSDFGIFQRCYSGENNPADPACAGTP